MEICSKGHNDAWGRRQEGKRLILHLHAHLQQRLFKSCRDPTAAAWPLFVLLSRGEAMLKCATNFRE